MKSFDLHTPLLKSIQKSLNSLEIGFEFPPLREGNHERASTSWIPDSKFGLLYLEEDYTWESSGEPEDYEPIMCDLDSDGRFRLRPADDDGYFFETIIRAGDEIPELLNFYNTTDAEKIGTAAIVNRSLKEIIDDIFILIPEKDGSYGLLSLLKDNWVMKDTGITKELDAHFVEGSYDLALDGIYVNLFYYFEATERWDELPPRSSLAPRDILLTSGYHPLYAGMFEQDAHSFIGSDPTLVIRLKPEVSSMWLTDYLEFAAESKGLLSELATNWKTLRRWLPKQAIRMPSIARDQVAESCIRRLSKHNYLHEVQRLSDIPEPFNDLSKLYKKRTEAVRSLHSSLLIEVDSMLNPLPYFIEYPYSVFRKSDDLMEQARSAQRLLGVFVKVPLFLVLEELLHSQHPLGAKILQQLEQRPPSDGTLLDFQKQISKELGANSPEVTIFDGLLQFFRNNTELSDLVSARNRMHHEPFDSQGFITCMERNAPIIIEKLRSALAGCEFLIPKQIQFINDSTVVSAENIGGFDAQFQNTEIETSLPPQVFQSGRIIVRKSKPENAFPIGHLLATKMIKQQTQDFGIFDRVSTNERKFVFLREDPSSDILART